MQSSINDIVIVGGGACGLVASIMIAKQNKSVLVLEKNSSLAKKIRVSGNGRCNISNTSISTKNYHFYNPALVQNILKNFNYEKSKKFFSYLGIEFVESDDGRVFPMSLDAKSVVAVLVEYAKSLGVRFELECEVESVKKSDKFEITSSNGVFFSKKLIICSGSTAYKSIGVSDIGYKIAKDFGHSLTDMFASLVQVKSSNKLIHKASGVKVNSKLKLFVDDKEIIQKSGDILFTNYGLSGLAILDISYFIAKYHDKNLSIMIDLLPNISHDKLKSLLLKRLNLKDKLEFESWLGAIINKKLIPLVTNSTQINKKTINQIAYNIKQLKVPIMRVRDSKYAEIIAGGVLDSEVDAKTLESTKVKGLYFGGEVLSVAGDRGGYNLHFAFGCGYSFAINPLSF